ncbi:hypothetical protein P7D98_02390 [Enterococcus avium]|jgi:hypothetical protein|nr:MULTISPECIES: hypothetical protein [Enterococcus]MDT2380629.1 hypothetical protein [Enterococcus avium]MDT2411082.1 hypothetical protein [Enterococcus avium]MDT2433878.1 hypothetical protein [Enterococcus avium]MDT2486428.1 hypothetical protein [Enterococcus avium]MDT2503920.1 hypothetical protein [Enterococcus avium]
MSATVFMNNKEIKNEGKNQMKNPFIVCHMMTSIDGRIDGKMTG